ncbi:enoyl-CoA hydratase-related protein [Tumebacillus lipolyticus]|uniref:Enoyl-CoA hydratase-related protein n=1 Tax=Tumebacillus lipolyticus TaxID=1280370 RepID=A0ABW5A3F2_9BACL
MYETILYKLQDGVLTLAFHRPDVLNAYNQQMGDELADALQRADTDDAVRTVVLTGTGRAFCVGQDLADRADLGAGTDLSASVRERYNPLIVRLQMMRKPIIAAVNGVAAGAGMSFALACDLRIASDRAKFTLAFSKIGLVPDSGASYFLPRLVGTGKAMELALTGEVISAQEAQAIGMVNRVVAAEELESVVEELATRLAKGPTFALGLTKRSIYHGSESDLFSALETEAKYQGLAGRSEDFHEGVQAFFAKRTPEFRGR